MAIFNAIVHNVVVSPERVGIARGADVRAVCAADRCAVHPGVLRRDDDYASARAADSLDVPDAVRSGRRRPADPVLRRLDVRRPPRLGAAATVLRPAERGRHRPVPLPAVPSPPPPRQTPPSDARPHSTRRLRLSAPPRSLKLGGHTAIDVFLAAAECRQPDGLPRSTDGARRLPVLGTAQQSSAGQLVM